VFIRHMWQLETFVFLHWCLMHAVTLRNILVHRDNEQLLRNILAYRKNEHLSSNIGLTRDLFKSYSNFYVSGPYISWKALKLLVLYLLWIMRWI